MASATFSHEAPAARPRTTKTVFQTRLPAVVKIKNGTIPTSKEQKEDHGYGLPQIQSILDQLGAEYAFDYKDGWFTFVAEIPL